MKFQILKSVLQGHLQRFGHIAAVCIASANIIPEVRAAKSAMKDLAQIHCSHDRLILISTSQETNTVVFGAPVEILLKRTGLHWRRNQAPVERTTLAVQLQQLRLVAAFRPAQEYSLTPNDVLGHGFVRFVSSAECFRLLRMEVTFRVGRRSEFSRLL